jgi:hypothetical protein
MKISTPRACAPRGVFYAPSERPMANFDIRFGELIDVYGRTATVKGLTFVPARIQLNGMMSSREHNFEEHPKFPREHIRELADAAFVRARIPRIFGYVPRYSMKTMRRRFCPMGLWPFFPTVERQYPSSAPTITEELVCCSVTEALTKICSGKFPTLFGRS